MTAASADAYPASLSFDAPERVANWRPLVHWLLAIPHLVVAYALNVVAEVVSIVSWFAILFTGKMPEGLAGVICMAQRYSIRAQMYVIWMVEDYPPFTFASTGADPGDMARVRIDFAPELTDRNRLTTFFRFILLIPHIIVLAVLGVAAFVCIVIGFFAVLFTGRWPAGLRDFVVNVMRWSVRFQAYQFLLTDRYPPFSLG